MMTLIKILVFSLTVLVGWSGGYSCADEAEQQIVIENAWVKALPPSVKNTAAYMSITNHFDHEIKLLSVESEVAESNEIHIMFMEAGRMTMSPITELPIEPHTSVALEPGGIHIMLIGLNNPVNSGDEVKLILHFDNDTTKTVIALAKHPLDAEFQDEVNHEHHHDHGGTRE